MKKFICLLLATTMALSLLSGCASSTTSSDASATYEIALITDVGNIDDKSFNQSAWEGVKQYGDDNDVSYGYYRPDEDSTVARVNTIKSAVDKGAKVIVCPGFLFEEAVFEAQSIYPDTQFLLLDGVPHNADYTDMTQGTNVHCINYQEEQSGYLAGYAAVKEGFTKLGFLGGMEIPAVQRFGYGYVQGIDAAAKEMGNAADISVNYWYSGVFAPSDDIKTKVDGWYTGGTKVVFACGGGIYLSALSAAEATTDGKVIGVDKDQAFESELIITSAMKDLTNSVVIALTKLYDNDGKWNDAAGEGVQILGAKDDCVGLPTVATSWRMTKFTVAEYETLYAKLKDGTITVSNKIDAAPTVTVKVIYQNEVKE